jgi:hypothetical protein
MWTLFLVCGPLCVEQEHKVICQHIGASKLTPWIHGGCTKNLKDARSSHRLHCTAAEENVHRLSIVVFLSWKPGRVFTLNESRR